MRIPKTSNRWQIKITTDGWLQTKSGKPLLVDDMREREDALFSIADNLGVWVVLNMMREGLPYCDTVVGCALQEPRLSLAAQFMENYQVDNIPKEITWFSYDSNREWLWKKELDEE